MSNLPYDAEIEYLQSTGTQYIDTGFKHNQNTRFLCDFEITAAVEWAHPFGSCGGTSGSNKLFLVEINNNLGLDTYYGTLPQKPFNNVPLLGRHHFDLNKNVHKIDNQTQTFSASTFQSDYNALIFGLTGYDGNPGQLVQGRCYYFRIYDNDVLVRDYIPVRVGNVGYLYDKVSGTLFGNSGTGDFILGNDKALPNPFGFRRRLMVFDCVQLLNAVKIYKETSLGLPCTTPNFSITLDCFVSDSETYPFFFGINPYGNNNWRKNKLLIVAVANTQARGMGVHINNSYKNNWTVKYFNERSIFKMENWKVYKNNTQILDATRIRQGMMNGSEFNIFPSVEGDVNNNYIVVYGGIIHIEGTLMRHIYPAQKGNDIGLYDSVTGNFYASEGAVEYI